MPHLLRSLLLGLFALALISPAADAAATRRDDRTPTAAKRPVAMNPVKGRTAAAPRRQQQRAARGATTRRSAGVASHDRRGGGIAGWQNGLPPAAGLQRDCPDGTMATLARGHEDVVRCMPI